MVELAPRERVFLLVVSLTVILGAGVGRIASRRPEAFPGLRLAGSMPAGEAPGRSARPQGERRPEAPASPGRSTLLDEQIRRVEEAVEAARTEGARDTARAADSAPTEPVDLNRASAKELTALPGIGPTLAERIVRDREARGPFRSVEDLARVRGIGPRTVDRLRGRAHVGARPGRH